MAATDLQTAEPLAGVALTLLDYQQQPLSEGRTTKDGTAILRAVRKPFLLIAKHADQTGFLKPDRQAFTYVAEKLACPPERILFLDDNQPNVDGARSTGLAAYRAHGAAGAAAVLKDLGILTD